MELLRISLLPWLIIFITLNLNIQSTISKSFEEDLTLTLNQKAILDQFRDKVRHRLTQPYMHEDVYLMRWLRARNWNIVEAENFLVQNLRWRKENNMDTIHDEDWSDLKKDFPFTLDSRDKFGRPVLYIHLRNLDLRRSVVSGNTEKLTRYIAKALDEACGLVRELGHKYHNVSQGLLLVNMDGFNLIEHGCLRCVPIILGLVLTYENHHPGCAEKIFLINTPSIYEPILTASRLLMSKDTQEALVVYGTNRRVWQEVLSSYFEMDQLPAELGGTKIDENLDGF